MGRVTYLHHYVGWLPLIPLILCLPPAESASLSFPPCGSQFYSLGTCWKPSYSRHGGGQTVTSGYVSAFWLGLL